MLTLIAILAIVGMFVVLGMYTASQGREVPKAQTQPRTPRAGRAEAPHPGWRTSVHRPDGTPVPGSREDRNEHGKP